MINYAMMWQIQCSSPPRHHHSQMAGLWRFLRDGRFIVMLTEGISAAPRSPHHTLNVCATQT